MGNFWGPLPAVLGRCKFVRESQKSRTDKVRAADLYHLPGADLSELSQRLAGERGSQLSLPHKSPTPALTWSWTAQEYMPDFATALASWREHELSVLMLEPKVIHSCSKLQGLMPLLLVKLLWDLYVPLAAILNVNDLGFCELKEKFNVRSYSNSPFPSIIGLVLLSRSMWSLHIRGKKVRD